MAYTEKLADRVRDLIYVHHKKVEEKKIFGGLCFMVNDKMCVTVKTERFMFRINPDKISSVMKKEGCKPVVMRGKKMKDFVFVTIDGLNTKKKLEYWVNLALEYNKIVKPSKKKKG